MPITVTVSEGRFVYLGKQGFAFQRVKNDGSYEETSSKPPKRFVRRPRKEAA